jgi:hypothetical protein
LGLRQNRGAPARQPSGPLSDRRVRSAVARTSRMAPRSRRPQDRHRCNSSRISIASLPRQSRRRPRCQHGDRATSTLHLLVAQSSHQAHASERAFPHSTCCGRLGAVRCGDRRRYRRTVPRRFPLSGPPSSSRPARCGMSRPLPADREKRLTGSFLVTGTSEPGQFHPFCGQGRGTLATHLHRPHRL